MRRDPSGSSLTSQCLNDFAVLVRFLTDAANGDSARVGSSGEIALPSLEQRRRTPRLPLRVPCKLQLPDRAVSAELVDISREGFGVQCIRAWTERQSLTIVFEDGRRMRAVVVRASRDRAGLRLETPLAANDPLFVRARSH
jgi:hypothetical protein